MLTKLPQILAGVTLIGILGKGSIDLYDNYRLVAETNVLLHKHTGLVEAVIKDVRTLEGSVNSLSLAMEDMRDTRVGVIYDNGREIILKLPAEYNSKKVKISYTE